MIPAIRFSTIAAGTLAATFVLGSAVAQTAPHGRDRGDRMAMHFDTDRDGRISRAEFEAGQAAMRERALKMFESADTDRDGMLTVEERRTFREAMRAQGGGPRDGLHRHRGEGRSPGSPVPSAPGATPGA